MIDTVPSDMATGMQLLSYFPPFQLWSIVINHEKTVEARGITASTATSL
jgi:hypothetical protein